MTQDSDQTPDLDTAPDTAPDTDVLTKDPASSEENLKRRDFIEKAGSVVVGGVIVACPAIAGLVSVMNPVINKTEGGYKVRLTVLDAIPADGVPRSFKVIVDKTDAWTTYKDLPLGLVFLRRTGEKEVEAFNASCPHAGCAVDFIGGGEDPHYYCSCHQSRFAMDGEVEGKSPAKRGLDTLEIDQEKLAEGEVWVNFQKFKAGVEEKIPVA